MGTGACNPNGISYAWIDPHGKVHETAHGHEEWAMRFVAAFPDMRREAEQGGEAGAVLMARGWIRFANFTAMQIWDEGTPTDQAWRAAIDLVRDCAIRTRDLDPFEPVVYVEAASARGRTELYSVADFIERFGGRRDSEAFFTSMMSRTASVARIAARYLAATALLPGREYLRVFNTARMDIERKIQAEDYVGAMDAFEAMAAQFRPVYEIATTIRVQRDDEKRRLQAFQDKIAPLRVLTRPGYIREGIESNTDVWARLSVTVDRLEEIAKYLSRNISRLEGYDAIARDFRHGPFRIVNAYGFRPEEYAAPLEILDSAAAAIRKAGFDSVLYGDVQLVGGKGAGFSGRYYFSNDIVQLNLDAKFRYDTVYTLIHEFGHRHWHIALSEADREAYIAAYNGTAPHLTVGDRQAILDALVQTEFSAARAERLLPPRLGEVLTQYLRERLGATTQRALQGDWARRPEELRLRIVVPRTSAYFVGDTRPHSVTDYGRTNPLEDYAEVFAHVVLGKVVDGRAYDRFQAALKGTL